MVIGEFLPQIERDTLIQKTQCVAHGTVRGFRDIFQRPFFHFHLLFFHQFPQPSGDRLYGDPAEIISLTAGQDRDRNLIGLRGRQYEDHIGRRFFQRLQKRVESSDRKHVNLVDNIDLVLAFRRRIRHLFPDFPDVVHTVIGRRVDLDHIHGRTCGDRTAGRAFSARIPVHRMFAVHRPGKDLRDSRLSGSSGSAEQIGMPDAVSADLVLQCCHNMILTLYIRKFRRAEFSVQCSIGHVYLLLF